MIDFKNECDVLAQEIENTQKSILELEQHLLSLPSTTSLKRTLANLRQIEDGVFVVKPTHSGAEKHQPKKVVSKKVVSKQRKLPKEKPAPDIKVKRTRRTKLQMQQWRSQLKNVCQLLGRRKDTFTTNSIVGAMIGQDLEADRQQVRAAALDLVEKNILERVDTNLWRLVPPQPKANPWYGR